MSEVRTVISAMNPRRYDGDYTIIMMTVWFEEFDGPMPFAASLFDTERHGKALWFRAMAGEFGPIEVLPVDDYIREVDPLHARAAYNVDLKEISADPVKLLTGTGDVT